MLSIAARSPAYDEVTSSSNNVGMMIAPFVRRNSKPSSEVPVAVRSSRSSEVGPSMTLP